MLETISREVNNAWLAGIIEGEGTFMAWFYKTKPERRGQHQLVTKISIVNNDAVILRKATEILSWNKIGYFYCLTKRKNKNHNNTLCVVVQGKGRVKNLINSIKPYLSGKLRQAEMMLNIINRREEMTHSYKRGQRIIDDEELLKFTKALKEMKHSLPVDPSETKRRANYPLSWKFEDIVRTA